MPPMYTVRAAVVDIRTDAPRPTDRFLVDTNVWAWAHYPGSLLTPAGRVAPQPPDYLPYLVQTRNAGAVRYRIALSLAELAHLIEQNELEGYSIGVGPLTIKEYRHNVPGERTRVVGEIQSTWVLVKSDSDPLPLLLDDGSADTAMSRLPATPVDGYDLLLLEAMSSGGISQLLTDDGDFACVSGIEVFTANPRVLAAARAQGRLVVR
jgi:hypothetical protein